MTDVTLIEPSPKEVPSLDGASVEAVRDANERARLPFARVLECCHIAGDRLDAGERQ